MERNEEHGKEDGSRLFKIDNASWKNFRGV